MQYKSILIKQLQGGNGTNIKPSYKGGVSTHSSDEHTDSLCSDSLVCGNSSPANPIGSNGSPLATSLKVKANRNDLAHGLKSFEEVGRDYTVEEIISIKQEVVEYLDRILKNIQDYLNNQEYLDSSTSS